MSWNGFASSFSRFPGIHPLKLNPMGGELDVV